MKTLARDKFGKLELVHQVGFRHICWKPWATWHSAGIRGVLTLKIFSTIFISMHCGLFLSLLFGCVRFYPYLEETVAKFMALKTKPFVWFMSHKQGRCKQ